MIARLRMSLPLILFILCVGVFASVFLWRPNYAYASRFGGVLKWVPLSTTMTSRKSFNLTEFGGVGDGRTDNTAAFVAAVRAIGRRGGGRLYVGSGVWLTGPFNLTSGMTLFLEREAVILGMEEEEKWPLLPPLPSYGYGREHAGPRYGSLIHGQHLKDVVITGNNGTIDGQGQVWWTRFSQKLLNYTRGPLVQFLYSQDIVVSNITLRNSPFWTLHPYDCKNVTISNVTILAPLHGAPNTDGIDPDSCDGVVIENCYIRVGDDGIAIKSGWDSYGIQYGRPSTNILIRNLIIRSVVSAGISIGSEMSGGVSDVTVENVHVWDSRRGMRIKTAPGRGGYIRNISYRNLTFTNCRVGIVIMTDYNEHPDEEFDATAIPTIENLAFTGIYGKAVRIPFRIMGSEDIPVKGISFQDVSVEVYRKNVRAFQCSYVQGRVVGSIYPEPCVNLDRYDENGRPVVLSDSQNASYIDYDL